MTVLRTKLTPPTVASNTIERPRLIHALAANDKSVALVSAPAGYGKSTTVAQSLQSVESAVAWMRVDRADNDPVRFWTHLAHALATAGTIDEHGLDAIVDDLEANRLRDAVDDLIVAIDDHAIDTVLVLDDVHEVANPETLEPLGELILNPPRNLQVVLVTRADPALPLGRLRARDAIFELRADDLAFTSDEALALLGHLADDTTVGPILHRTHGWATALRMLAVAADRADQLSELLISSAADTSDLASFLAGEVLERQGPDTQAFLIATSILDELVPELCDAVTGRDDSLAVLKRLSRTHVFTEHIDDTTFHYHPLFADFLRSRFAELGNTHRDQLHTTAADWLADHGDSSSAIHHRLAAGDRAGALDQIQASWVRYAQQGLWATINQWITDYGVDAARTDEDLSLAAAWLALNTRRYDAIGAWIDDRDSTSINFEIQAAALRSYRARHLGDITDAVEHGLRSVELLDGDLDQPAASTALTAHGTAQALTGNDDTSTLDTAHELGLRNNMVTSVTESRSFLALIASRDPDQHDTARQHIAAVNDLVRTPADERFHQPAAAWLAAARIARHDGRLADAARDATRALNIAADAAEPALQLLVECENARIAHAQGDTISARAAHRRAKALLTDQSGQHLVGELRATGNAIRYADVSANADLPIGARELTDRELAVLRNLDNDLTRTELAAQLFISENTLKSHLAAIGRKLGVRKRRDIITRAKELDLI